MTFFQSTLNIHKIHAADDLWFIASAGSHFFILSAMLTRRLLSSRGNGATSSIASSVSSFVLSRPIHAWAHPTATFTVSRIRPTSQHLCVHRLSTISTKNGPPHTTVEVPDLSYVSEPMGALYPSFPKCRTALSPFLLTDEQLASYEENGYISNLPALSEEQCDSILADYKQFLLWDKPSARDSLNDAHRLQHPGMHLFHEFHSNQTGDSQNVLSHMLGQWRISPLFHDLIFHPALSVPSSQCMAAFFNTIPSSSVQPSTSPVALVPVSFWHDQLFAKPPHHGGNVAWHQDYSYWTRTGPCNHLTVHLALDDQTLENGSLHFIPGSHRWTRTQYNPHTQQDETLPLPITDINFADMDSIRSALTETEQQQFVPVPGLLKKGQVSIHHPFTVHGSYPNRSDKPRRAAVVNYFVTGTRSQTNEPLLNGMEVIAKNHELKSRFFPVVFQPQWMSK